MAYWIELRCDVRRPPCRSNQNNDPHAYAADGSFGLKHVREEARKQGWVPFGKGQWACPACRVFVGKS